jgi:hypothetical protein
MEKLACRTIGHRWQSVGEHRVGGYPSHYQYDMDSVRRGSIAFKDYVCSRCGAESSDEVPYSWRVDTPKPSQAREVLYSGMVEEGE